MEKLKIPLAEIKRLYIDEKSTLREIARKAGVTHQNIYHHLKALGVGRRSRKLRRAKYPRFESEMMHDLYVTQGLSMKEIGRQLGISWTTVKNELAAHGIKTGRWLQLTPENRATNSEAARLYSEGWSVQRIASHLDRSIGAIHRVLARAGVELRYLKLVKRELDYDELKRLYVDEKMSVKKLCKTFGVGKEKLEHELIRLKIPLRKGNRKVQHPKLARLQVGESTQFPRKSKRNYNRVFYDDARRIGIQVSVETIDQNWVRVRRTL